MRQLLGADIVHHFKHFSCYKYSVSSLYTGDQLVKEDEDGGSLNRTLISLASSASGKLPSLQLILTSQWPFEGHT
jgi:hypothetical protein